MIIFSCTKEENIIPMPPETQVSYKITIRMNWSSPNFTVPANVHFTRLIGMLHSKDSFLWGQQATMGLEYLAEAGINGNINNEIDTIIARQKALARFGMNAPVATGSVDSTFTFTTTHSCFSFASMIAPSPDWFIGINAFNLLENNQWIKDKTVDLFVHDAGTEDGDVFGYNNPATIPQQNISLLTAANATVLANGNTMLSKMGTIRFVEN